MSDEKIGALHSASDGGVTGKHASPDSLKFHVGPSTSNEFNTARLQLIPIACFRIDDMRFKFDSSFVLPETQSELTEFLALRKSDLRVDGAPISIFGHADPSFQGNFELGSSTQQSGDDYNKVLSGRRAIAIYALLVRDPSFWNTLYSNHLGRDLWGEDSIRIILDSLDQESGSAGQQSQSQSSRSGSSSQSSSDSARDARVRDIANDSGQRQQLFLKYMNLLCGELKLEKGKDFLARGAGPDQKGDVQGCSRFNPLLLFSQEKEAEFKSADQNKNQAVLATRNAGNAPNRRVMIFVFRKGSQVLSAKWPCPSYKEGVAGCKKRFFSNGDARRATHAPNVDSNFEQTHDTFACRFYQRISEGSPCNTPIQFATLTIRLLDVYHKPIKKTKYVLRVGALELKGQTDDNGIFSRPIPSTATTATLILPMWTVDLVIQALDTADSATGAMHRLDNLGFFAQNPEGDDAASLALMRFQSVCDEQQTDERDSDGKMNAATRDKLEGAYGT
jgi:outer membrane protein OmpA-like peptidoglycan-associated protein